MGRLTLLALQLSVVSIKTNEIQWRENPILHKPHHNVCGGSKRSEVRFGSDSGTKRLANGEDVDIGHSVIVRPNRCTACWTKPCRKIAWCHAMMTDRDGIRRTYCDVEFVRPWIRSFERSNPLSKSRGDNFSETYRCPVRLQVHSRIQRSAPHLSARWRLAFGDGRFPFLVRLVFILWFRVRSSSAPLRETCLHLISGARETEAARQEWSMGAAGSPE